MRTTVNNDEAPSFSSAAFPDGPIRDPLAWNLAIDRLNADINKETLQNEL